MSSKSSRRWLDRQRRDPFVKQARRQGLPSRSSFKLSELDERERLFRRGMTVVDLGAAPGGWSRYAAERVGDHGRVIALDLLEMSVPAGVVFLQGDFREQAVLDRLLETIDGRGVDLVISDMAPNMSGIRSADQARSMALAELAFDLAERVLLPSGSFLVKLFQGAGFDDYVRLARSRFGSTKLRKPAASRADSREVYLLSRNFGKG
jgi:23S rRNA (uridine2552-2'-O)-methyltransferase